MPCLEALSSLSLPGLSPFQPPRSPQGGKGLGSSPGPRVARAGPAPGAQLSSEHSLQRCQFSLPPSQAGRNTPPHTASKKSYFRVALFFFSPFSSFFNSFFFFNKQPISPHLGCELGASSSAPNAQRLLFINASKPKIPSRAAGMHPGGSCIQQDAAPLMKPLSPSSAHPTELLEVARARNPQTSRLGAKICLCG